MTQKEIKKLKFPCKLRYMSNPPILDKDYFNLPWGKNFTAIKLKKVVNNIDFILDNEGNTHTPSFLEKV